jgi:hypothetical protein
MEITAENIREDLAELLREQIGIYQFAGGSNVPAIVTAYSSQAHTDRSVSGLEVIVLKTPTAVMARKTYQVWLKQYAEGYQGLSEAIDLIRGYCPQATINPVSGDENRQLMGVVSVKIPVIQMMGD